MNDLQIFNNEEFGEVRTAVIMMNLCFVWLIYVKRWNLHSHQR